MSVGFGIELGMPELKNMYNIKETIVDEGRVDVSFLSSCKLALILPKSILG